MRKSITIMQGLATGCHEKNKPLLKYLSLILLVLLAYGSNAQNVNVNPGAGSYPTLKAAFDAINAGTHTGAVTMDIVASTAEPVTATLNASGVGAANYTSVTITTSFGGVSIVGSDTVTIKLAGADNVTIDGRIGGTGRNITVSNTKVLTNATAIRIAHGGFNPADSAGAQNNVIRNLEIACGVAQNASTTVTFGINSGGTTHGNVSGRNNDNNQYLENRIIRCRIGINLNGGTAVNLNDNNIISGNIVGPTSFGADEIGGTGIFVQFQNLCSITNNLVQFVGGDFANTTAGADRVGIGLGQNAWTSTSTTTTTASNNIVAGNIIHDIIEERTFSAVGIVAGTTLSGPKTNNVIANNVIYNVRANSTPGDQCIGIGHTGGPGDKIVFNSISMTGDLDPAAAGTATTNPIAAGIAKHLAAAADTAVFIKNNSILLDVNTNTSTLLKVAIIGPAAGYAFGSGGLNNNDYFIPSPGTNGNITGVTGTGITPTFITLANWQTAYTPAQDGASIQASPIYNSTTFLKPVTGSPLVNAGTPVASVPLDIEGITRSGATPTIGAYENTTAPPPPDAGVSLAIVGTPVTILGTGGTYNLVATAKNLGSAAFSVCPVYYRVNGGSPVGPVNTVGPIAPGGTENVTFSGANAFSPVTAGSYTIKAWTELPTDVVTANDTFSFVITVMDPIAAFPYVQSFTTPTNWTITIENTVGTTALWGLGICKNAFGKAGDTAATANCFNGSSGRVEVLRSPLINLTSMVNPVVHFYSSYRTFTGTECDTMDVLVSTDGGVTFIPATTIYKKHRNSTPSLSTRPGTGSAFFPDSAVQWRYETVSLANMAGLNNVVIGFRSHSNFGNRMWVDDVIVTDANNTCTNIFNAPGNYSCDASLGVQMVTANPASSEMRTTRHNAQDPPFTVASPSVATNTTATTNNGAIFTPTYLGKVKWWTVSYTGNDQSNGNAAGFTTFNLSIDVTTLESLTYPDSVYIVRRADALDQWTAFNTTRTGNILTVSGLTLFGDFAIATTVTNACVTPNAAITPPSATLTCASPTVLLTASGGGTYLWSTGATTTSITVSSANTYTVTVTSAGGCTASASATVAGNTTPPGAAVTPPSAIISCASPTALLTASGGGTYLWSTGATTTSISVSSANTYTVTVTGANGCTATASATVTGNTTPPSAAVTPPSATITCASPTALLTASGGGTYLWSTGATTTSISVSSANTYTVTVTGANGCTASASATVTGNTTPPSAAVTPPSAIISCASPTALLTASGGGTYLWSTGATTTSISVSSANTYTVTVTGANGCTATASATVTGNTTPPSAAVTPPSATLTCASPTALLTASGGGTYLWSTGATTTSISVSSANTYTVTVTGANGCTASASSTVTGNTTPPSAAVTPPSATLTCASPTALLTASGGGTYLWSTGATTTSISVSSANTYTVTVTGANGCTATASAVVSSSPTVSPAITGDLSLCGDSSATLDAGAGYTIYSWSTGATTQAITVSTANTFTVTVTDVNGCTGSTSATTSFENCCNISLSGIVTNVTCNGGSDGSINVTSSNLFGSPSYTWSDGNTNEDRTGLVGGTYSVTVNYGAGCTASQGFSVLVPAALAINGTKVNISCRGNNTGSITLAPTGNTPPYSYLWNNGSTSQNRTGLAPGTYTVTVNDAGLCGSQTASFTITQPATNLILNSSKTNIRCAGMNSGLATVSPAGGTSPYSYSWNTFPVSTTATISSLVAGAYTCTVTDAGGCTKTVVIVITEPPPLSAIPSQTNVTFPGGNNGTASVAVSGGTPGYTYLWNTVPVKTTSSVTGLSAGVYKCTITDSKGCILKITFTITEPSSRSFVPPLDNLMKVGVYPNPSNGIMLVKISGLAESENIDLFLFDISGRIVYNIHTSWNREEERLFDFSLLSKGLYYLHCKSAEGTAIQKIVIQ